MTENITKLSQLAEQQLINFQQEYQQETKTKQDRQTYFNYYNNRPEIKEKRKLMRLKKSLEKKHQDQEATSKYYGSEAIKVLMSFKDYTELSKEKRQLWLDFNWTFQDCQKSFSEGYADIVAIMKLEQVAGRLTRDFWKTAKNEERQKSRSWNVLSEEEKDRLIKFWGRQKANIENDYIDEDEKLERQGKEYEREIEIQKHHEERGKIKCKCWQCEGKKNIQNEVKENLKKDIEDYDQRNGATDKEECPQCGKLKILGEESGLCKNCSD